MSDSTKKFLSLDGLAHLKELLKTKFSKKVDKELKTGSTSAYKVLSDNNLTDALVEKINNAGASNFSGDYNDLTNKPENLVSDSNYVHTDNNYTSTEKTKLGSIAENAQVNTIESVKVNGTALSITSKAVDITVPTNNNQLTNGAGYQTSEQVQSAINDALSGITGIDFQVVSALPATGVKGTIYLVSNGGSTPNIYDEYVWVTDKFEKIGTTAVDLSGYLKKTDMVEITNEEIDTICVF